MRERVRPLVLLDHRVVAHHSVVNSFEYPVPMVSTIIDSTKRQKSNDLPPWNHSGTWKPNNGNYFFLGGLREGTTFMYLVANLSPFMGHTKSEKTSYLYRSWSRGQNDSLNEDHQERVISNEYPSIGRPGYLD